MENKAVDILQKFVENSSLEIMKKYTHTPSFKIDTGCSDLLSTPEFGEKLSIIMLWGKIGSLVLKIHYESAAAIAITMDTFEKKDNKINIEIGCDFMKEFCNLQAGFIKGFFEKENIFFCMSMPFLADGQDEITFKKIRDPRAKFSVWKISNEQYSFVLTSEICLLEREPIMLIKDVLLKGSTEVSNEVEFF